VIGAVEFVGDGLVDWRRDRPGGRVAIETAVNGNGFASHGLASARAGRKKRQQPSMTRNALAQLPAFACIFNNCSETIER
jgi:hypothetical protein